MTAEDDRQARLAAALRANLRRRKAAAPAGAPSRHDAEEGRGDDVPDEPDWTIGDGSIP